MVGAFRAHGGDRGEWESAADTDEGGLMRWRKTVIDRRVEPLVRAHMQPPDPKSCWPGSRPWPRWLIRVSQRAGSPWPDSPCTRVSEAARTERGICRCL